MNNKRVAAKQNSRTGSYTVRVPKSAVSGTFSAAQPKTGRIVIPETPAKSN